MILGAPVMMLPLLAVARTQAFDPGPAPQGPVLVIAHRGASGLAPEHTFASWDLALEQGADYLELDLQMTADGVLVVSHDETLDRTARGPDPDCTGPVRERTLAQIRHCDVGSWFNDAHPDHARPEYVGLRIPTLGEVLDRYGARARYYIETKSPAEAPGMEQLLLDQIRAHGLDAPTGRAELPAVIVQSFHPESLLRVRQLEPAIPLIQLVPARESSASIQAQLSQVASYAWGIGPQHEDVDAELIAAAHALGLRVHPYTVDDPSRMRQLLRIGIDGLFTDLPGLLRGILDAQDGE